MSKIKQYAAEIFDEEGFEEYLDAQIKEMEGENHERK